MWVKRYGNDGLKMIADQLSAKNCPSRISYPAGVCIHELSAKIQKADKEVPKATRKVEIK